MTSYYTTIDEACSAPEILARDMNPEHKKKWVEALCAGDYVQITGSLRTEDAYCCLGVAADVLVDHKFWNDGTLYVFSSEQAFEQNHKDLLEMLKGDDHNEGYDYAEASEASEYCGTDILNSLGIHQHMAELLALLNDDMRLSFMQIAEFVGSKYFPLLNCNREQLPDVVKKAVEYLSAGGLAHWVVMKMGWAPEPGADY